MKKVLLGLSFVLSLSIGCSKIEELPKEEKTILYCSECTSESNEASKYCKECGVEAKWVSEKPEVKDEEDEKNKENTETKEESEYDKGYKAGYKAGYKHTQVSEVGGDYVRTYTDYDNGYVDGYNDGMNDCYKNGDDYESNHKDSTSVDLGDRAPAAFDGSCGVCGSWNMKILDNDEAECLDCGAYKDFYTWWPGN